MATPDARRAPRRMGRPIAGARARLRSSGPPGGRSRNRRTGPGRSIRLDRGNRQPGVVRRRRAGRGADRIHPPRRAVGRQQECRQSGERHQDDSALRNRRRSARGRLHLRPRDGSGLAGRPGVAAAGGSDLRGGRAVSAGRGTRLYPGDRAQPLLAGARLARRRPRSGRRGRTVVGIRHGSGPSRTGRRGVRAESSRPRCRVPGRLGRRPRDGDGDGGTAPPDLGCAHRHGAGTGTGTGQPHVRQRHAATARPPAAPTM